MYKPYRYFMHSAIRSILITIFLLAYSSEGGIAQPLDSTGNTHNPTYHWDRFSVQLGTFLAYMNSDLSLGSQNLGLGININLEDALGLATSNAVMRGEMEYSFGKRRRSIFHMGYFGLQRKADKILESEIRIGNSTFPIGTEVNSTFNLDIIRATYEYAFFFDERIRLGASLGAYIMPVTFSVGALGRSEEATQFVAPLPVVGILTEFRITPKVSLKENIQLLYLQFSDYKGSISDINIQLEYNPWQHFGFGLGVNSFRFNFIHDGSGKIFNEFEGSFSTGFTGLLLYARYGF